jgi:hypothetical protein
VSRWSRKCGILRPPRRYGDSFLYFIIPILYHCFLYPYPTIVTPARSCCRYVQPGGTRSSYNFVIPLHDCGTAPSGGFGRTVDNIIVIQTDDTVQVSPPLEYEQQLRGPRITRFILRSQEPATGSLSSATRVEATFSSPILSLFLILSSPNLRLSFPNKL